VVVVALAEELRIQEQPVVDTQWIDMDAYHIERVAGHTVVAEGCDHKAVDVRRTSAVHVAVHDAVRAVAHAVVHVAVHAADSHHALGPVA